MSGLETIANRAILKHAVQQQIFCQYSGVVLDIRKDVYVSIMRGDATISAGAIAGDHWDKVKDTVEAATAEKGLTLEVIDGREINGKPT